MWCITLKISALCKYLQRLTKKKAITNNYSGYHKSIFS
ncbi:hypothetical protein PCARR_a1532 [Pseudoalteromonas carrageenovora IAM 12662]|uniref:Uncharacterized protein n=1 Tax=Pseudoalteromonas carrageenovora IAM 12662 TaxID=1314868 RepID=A0ABR9ES31_PSEVC|nr:hypothetical protein [Pseudoalteromonas carrageenovora IAM 12662]